MTASGWLRHGLLQSSPGEFPLTWYAAGLVVVTLLGATAIGTRRTRREPAREEVIAPAELIEAVEEPLALLREDGTVLAANDAFGDLVGGGDPDAIEDAIGAQPALGSAIENREDEVVSLQRAEENRRYRVRTYPVGDRPDRRWIVLLHDITDHHKRQAQLEAEKEQLDQFASLISHDLRNPLDVAIGRTNAVAEAIDDPEHTKHLSRVQESHQRMKQIITDVLTLAREGHSIGSTDCVPLETAAMDAWAHVDTDGAELSVNTQLVIEADGERLTRIFENLFRNAVEHGGEGVHIEVAALAEGSGFYVADDGEGIHPDERTAVLEAGYTSGADGTGLGLAIVTGIAEAHGWRLRITDGDDGGARFEFSGVDQASENLATRSG